MKIVIFGVFSQRTKCYVENLLKMNDEFKIKLILIQQKLLFNDNHSFCSVLRPDYVVCPVTGVSWNANLTLESLSDMVQIQELSTDNPNSELVQGALKNENSDLIIYSGPPGVILNKATLSNLNFKIVHSHSGLLPKYKGSTTIFYSTLIDNSISASLFQMSEEIDSGNVLTSVTYNLHSEIDYLTFESVTDSAIRWKAIEKFLSGSNQTEGREALESSDKNVFFICHPVIRSITFSRSTKI